MMGAFDLPNDKLIKNFILQYGKYIIPSKNVLNNLEVGIDPRNNKRVIKLIEKELSVVKSSWHLLCLLLMLSFNAFATDRISLSEDETAYLNKHKYFTLCADPHWMPFEKIKNGKYTGISADYFKLFAQKLGTEFRLQPTSTWQETLQRVKNNECDLLSLYLTTAGPLQHIKLTQPFISTPLVLATQKNQRFISKLSDLQGKKIAIVHGYSYEFALNKEVSDIVLVKVNSPEEGIDLVVKGEAFGYIDVFPVIAYLIQTKFFNEVAVSAKLDLPLKFASGVSVNHPLLLTALNKAIISLSGDDKLEIFNDHFKIEYQEQHIYDSKEFFVSLLIIFLFSLFFAWRYKIIKNHNYAMQSQVDIIDTNVLLLITKANGVIRYVSNAFSKKSGYRESDLNGLLVKRLKFYKEKNKDAEIRNAIFASGFWRGEIKIRKKGGGYFWAEVTIVKSKTIQKHYSGYHIIFNDITNEKILEKVSKTDTLTKLNNRLLLDERFKTEFLRVSRYQTRLSVLIIDIDFFKLVNDDHGHHVGDQVLITFANILKTMARETDIVGRWGGEEFLVICPETSIKGALTLAEKIRKHVEKQDFPSGSRITCSIGVTQYKQGDLQNDMFIRSDHALYQAKKEGRNKVSYHD